VKAATHQRPLNCAIYTRKSTEEGLEQEFNTLDAQRESAECYIKSQETEGWVCLPQHYDDGGYTGGNMERPALKRLLADIEAGKVDCVVVYKVDRLSRSLMDFAKMLEVFERKNIAFVSVTQQFNTTNSMGRLMLNVLLSFAQFEREIISERTRDKMAAARRKGKWIGGLAPLGYDIDPVARRLKVNEGEASRVRSIFELYLEVGSIISTLKELDRREWRNKRSITRKGKERGGRHFDKSSLFKLLTNMAYIGKIRYKDEVHSGEHEPIVSIALWDSVQKLLKHNGKTGGVAIRNKFGALLKGLVRCVCCDAAMTPNHTTKAGNKRYRYYVCSAAQKRGWHTCPSKSIPAKQIEDFVVSQVKKIGYAPHILKDVVEATKLKAQKYLLQLKEERVTLESDTARWSKEVFKMTSNITSNDTESPAIARLADLQERIQQNDRRMLVIDKELAEIDISVHNHVEVESTVLSFDPIWEAMTLRDQIRLLNMIVRRIDYDGESGRVTITFHPLDGKSQSEYATKELLQV
jgi:site-specific DNA recombinase